MDINVIRTAVTVLAFLAFLGIVVWAWSGKRKARFEHAARSVLSDDDEQSNVRPVASKGA